MADEPSDRETSAGDGRDAPAGSGDGSSGSDGSPTGSGDGSAGSDGSPTGSDAGSAGSGGSSARNGGGSAGSGGSSARNGGGSAGSGAGPPGSRAETGNAEENDEVDRTRLLRVVIVLAIGIPILVEAVTLVGLVGGPLHGDGTATDTPAGAAVGVGDQFLPETATNETVTTASVTAGDDGWQFVLGVAVANVSNRSYELALTAVRTTEGTERSGTSSTGPIEPGGSGTVTATWRLPAGEQPAVVTARVGRGNDPPTTYQVRLAAVPVQS